MTQASAESWVLPFEKAQEMLAVRTPVRRVGQPEDIAYLVGENAGFVTGEVIYAAGGPSPGG